MNCRILIALLLAIVSLEIDPVVGDLALRGRRSRALKGDKSGKEKSGKEKSKKKGMSEKDKSSGKGGSGGPKSGKGSNSSGGSGNGPSPSGQMNGGGGGGQMNGGGGGQMNGGGGGQMNADGGGQMNADSGGQMNAMKPKNGSGATGSGGGNKDGKKGPFTPFTRPPTPVPTPLPTPMPTISPSMAPSLSISPSTQPSFEPCPCFTAEELESITTENQLTVGNSCARIPGVESFRISDWDLKSFAVSFERSSCSRSRPAGTMQSPVPVNGCAQLIFDRCKAIGSPIPDPDVGRQ